MDPGQMSMIFSEVLGAVAVVLLGFCLAATR
jgi:hypothetical protein